MWAEDDLDPAVPCLESCSEPTDGKVYRMYHGTSRKDAELIRRGGFKQSPGGMLGRGVYLSRDIKKARNYPLHLPEHQKVVIKVKVNVGRVKRIDYQGHPLQQTWHDNGYDTAWCPPKCGMVKSGLEEDCVWDPSRIEVIKIIRPKITSPPFQMNHGIPSEAAAQLVRIDFNRSGNYPFGHGVYLRQDLERARPILEQCVDPRLFQARPFFDG